MVNLMVTVGDYGGGAHPSWTTVMRGKFKEFCQILAKPRKFQRSIVGCCGLPNVAQHGGAK